MRLVAPILAACLLSHAARQMPGWSIIEMFTCSDLIVQETFPLTKAYGDLYREDGADTIHTWIHDQNFG